MQDNRKTVSDFIQLISESNIDNAPDRDPREKASLDSVQVYCITTQGGAEDKVHDHYVMSAAGLPNVTRVIGGRILGALNYLESMDLHPEDDPPAKHRIIKIDLVGEVPYWGPRFFDEVLSREVTELAGVTGVAEEKMKKILRTISSYRRNA